MRGTNIKWRAVSQETEWREYEFLEKDRQYNLILAFSRAALQRVAESPVPAALKKSAIIQALIDRGAFYQDFINDRGQRISAFQQTDRKKCTRIVVDVQGGLKNDTTPDIPACRKIDLKTGLIIDAESYQNDKFIRQYHPDELVKLNIRLGLLQGSAPASAKKLHAAMEKKL